MRSYHRVMRRREPDTYSDDERAALLQVLRTAPGAADDAAVERHPRGGYKVRLALAAEQLDAFCAHLDQHDWTLGV